MIKVAASKENVWFHKLCGLFVGMQAEEAIKIKYL